MAIEIDGESIEIVDAHIHMGGRPRREKFDAEKNSAAGRAYYYSYSGKQVVNAMDQSGVDTVVGFPLGGFSSEYDYADQNEMIAASMKEFLVESLDSAASIPTSARSRQPQQSIVVSGTWE